MNDIEDHSCVTCFDLPSSHSTNLRTPTYAVVALVLSKRRSHSYACEVLFRSDREKFSFIPEYHISNCRYSFFLSFWNCPLCHHNVSRLFLFFKSNCRSTNMISTTVRFYFVCRQRFLLPAKTSPLIPTRNSTILLLRSKVRENIMSPSSYYLSPWFHSVSRLPPLPIVVLHFEFILLALTIEIPI